MTPQEYFNYRINTVGLLFASTTEKVARLNAYNFIFSPLMSGIKNVDDFLQEITVSKSFKYLINQKPNPLFFNNEKAYHAFNDDTDQAVFMEVFSQKDIKNNTNTSLSFYEISKHSAFKPEILFYNTFNLAGFDNLERLSVE